MKIIIIGHRQVSPSPSLKAVSSVHENQMLLETIPSSHVIVPSRAVQSVAPSPFRSYHHVYKFLPVYPSLARQVRLRNHVCHVLVGGRGTLLDRRVYNPEVLERDHAVAILVKHVERPTQLLPGIATRNKRRCDNLKRLGRDPKTWAGAGLVGGVPWRRHAVFGEEVVDPGFWQVEPKRLQAEFELVVVQVPVMVLVKEGKLCTEARLVRRYFCRKNEGRMDSQQAAKKGNRRRIQVDKRRRGRGRGDEYPQPV